MRKISKSIRYSLMISGFMIATTNHLEAATCPTLNRDQVRTLCRWDALKNIPLLKIEAKKITIDGATLQNKHDSCREKDSVSQFLTKNAAQTYEGKVSKDFKAPSDHSQVLCLYHIDKEVFGFSAEGVPHPDAHAKPDTVAKKEEIPPQTPPKKPKMFGGVDITTSPEVKKVPFHEPLPVIKKEPVVQPQVAPHRPGQPPRPNPLPGGLRPPSQPDATSSESKPPNRPPPMAPKRQAVQYDEPPLEGSENVPQVTKRPLPRLPKQDLGEGE